MYTDKTQFLIKNPSDHDAGRKVGLRTNAVDELGTLGTRVDAAHTTKYGFMSLSRNYGK
jgi:hypothetical protein